MSALNLERIHLEDLPYVERDLNFAQKVSLAFLLYGDQHSNASYALQKLLALAHNNNNSNSNGNHANLRQHSDLLQQYANTNPTHWRAHLVEALAIIDARRVLRKLGFCWQELRLHYLPHIKEVALHVHPLLKSLYLICEQLTVAQSGRLVIEINDKQAQKLAAASAASSGSLSDAHHMRFYDFAYMEIFLLDWLTRRILQLGDINAEGSDMTALIEYFKFNEMQALSTQLIETINSNATKVTTTKKEEEKEVKLEQDANVNGHPAVAKDSKDSNEQPREPAQQPQRRHQNVFVVRRENAGIVLIINQTKFHRDVSEDLKPLLPKKHLTPRLGSDVDKKRLELVFTRFGYTVEAHDNLDHLELLTCLRDVCARSFLRDSLIVCILSHGFRDAIYGHDSIALRISDIENVICADKHLPSKPKLLITQACQQEEPEERTVNINASTRSAVQHVNLLKAMSSVANYAAMRDTLQGSWFIQALCDAIEQRAHSEHMLELLTHVIRMVSNKRGNKNELMVPKSESTLRQHFYLPSIN